MPKKNNPKKIILSPKEADELQKDIKASNLSPDVVTLVLGLINFNLWLQQQLEQAKLSIKKLKRLFGFKNESLDKSNNNDSTNKTANDTDNNISKPNNNENESKTSKPTNWDKNKNHGRYSAADYTGCPIHHVPFSNEVLKQGLCPVCAKDGVIAKITPEDPTLLVFLESSPMISGERYSLEKGRCLVCNTYFTAPLPDECAHRPKYSPSCITSLVIHHYYGGMPFKRIESLQQLQGVPFADATQYDYINRFYKASVAPVIEVLRSCAANGNSLYFDDSPGRILEQMEINKHSPKNKASIHITALLSVYQEHRIYLFNTSSLTAGKEFAKLLEDRTSKESFTTMTDGSASNFPTLNDDLMARWVISLCLSHGRRYFVDLLGDGDGDIAMVLDIIAKVYANEKYCKQNRLSDDDRLRYHQEHSAPLMKALHTWLNNLILHKNVEPNSPLGKAIIYLLKRWQWLTQFLYVPGAALDNNICEIAIKVAIRYRKNSLFYKTFYGAIIGDAMMSLLHTAAHADINVFDYLNVLQDYTEEVQTTPENWLPWNYQQTLASMQTTELNYENSG